MKALLVKHGQGERAKPTTSRGGLPFSPDDYTFEEYQALFPIPADQIRINPSIGLIIQKFDSIIRLLLQFILKKWV